MAYFSHYVHQPGQVYAYTRRVVLDIRHRTGQPTLPIHVIGGLASDTSTAATAAFVRAVRDCAVIGASLYAYPQTTRAQWNQLAAVTVLKASTTTNCRARCETSTATAKPKRRNCRQLPAP